MLCSPVCDTINFNSVEATTNNIFERSNEKNNFSKTKIYFNLETTSQLLERIRLQNMKVVVKTNFGRLATVFQIFPMDADILS